MQVVKCIEGIENQNNAMLHLNKAIGLYYCTYPVIGQEARYIWIAAFSKIITVAKLYFNFLYPQNTRTWYFQKMCLYICIWCV